ncbi:hypothetical protein SBADM41S_08571 [Streptomyces badius]
MLQARLYDAKTDTYKRVADPAVGRNYHSGSVLLPDGRVMIFGSDSLFSDKANTRPGVFEQRIEIYTPPYLYRDSRPELTAGPKKIERGSTGLFTTQHASKITSAKPTRPSAVTHVTDTDQRTIALEMEKSEDGVTVTVPDNPALVPARLVHAVRHRRAGHPVRGHVGGGARVGLTHGGRPHTGARSARRSVSG